jgi:hypothetical protein
LILSGVISGANGAGANDTLSGANGVGANGAGAGLLEIKLLSILIYIYS